MLGYITHMVAQIVKPKIVTIVALQIVSLVLGVVRLLAVAVNIMSLYNKSPPVGGVVPTLQDGTLATDHITTTAVAFATEMAVMGVGRVVLVVNRRMYAAFVVAVAGIVMAVAMVSAVRMEARAVRARQEHALVLLGLLDPDVRQILMTARPTHVKGLALVPIRSTITIATVPLVIRGQGSRYARL